jgi:hypothetical protein
MAQSHLFFFDLKIAKLSKEGKLMCKRKLTSSWIPLGPDIRVEEVPTYHPAERPHIAAGCSSRPTALVPGLSTAFKWVIWIEMSDVSTSTKDCQFRFSLLL